MPSLKEKALNIIFSDEYAAEEVKKAAVVYKKQTGLDRDQIVKNILAPRVDTTTSFNLNTHNQLKQELHYAYTKIRNLETELTKSERDRDLADRLLKMKHEDNKILEEKISEYETSKNKRGDYFPIKLIAYIVIAVFSSYNLLYGVIATVIMTIIFCCADY